jgi:hypothetical protein
MDLFRWNASGKSPGIPLERLRRGVVVADRDICFGTMVALLKAFDERVAEWGT